jgi:hypothetical protein
MSHIANALDSLAQEVRDLQGKLADAEGKLAARGNFMISTREQAIETFRGQVDFCTKEAEGLDGERLSFWLGMAAGYRLSAEMLEDTWSALHERVAAREAM